MAAVQGESYVFWYLPPIQDAPLADSAKLPSPVENINEYNEQLRFANK